MSQHFLRHGTPNRRSHIDILVRQEICSLVPKISILSKVFARRPRRWTELLTPQRSANPVNQHRFVHIVHRHATGQACVTKSATRLVSALGRRRDTLTSYHRIASMTAQASVRGRAQLRCSSHTTRGSAGTACAAAARASPRPSPPSLCQLLLPATGPAAAGGWAQKLVLRATASQQVLGL